MPTIAFLTDRVRPSGVADDHLVLPALTALGVTVRFVPWEDARPQEDIAAWVVRSPWNYAAAVSSFLSSLAPLAPLHNAMTVLRWNSDKRYLFELAEAGVPIVPSVVAPRDALAAIAESTGFVEVVVKPLVSAGGSNTRRVRAENLDDDDIFAGLPDGDYLMQPFLDDVLAGGEVSCVFFEGVYSHSVRKRPQAGNFLVQEEHGGSTVAVIVTPELIEASQAALAAAPAPGLYARVDWIETRRGPRLVELELIEPELYLRAHPDAPARFAAAIVGRLERR